MCPLASNSPYELAFSLLCAHVVLFTRCPFLCYAGELHELKEELSVQKPEKKRDAIKKVIAAMTVGKDVSSLFPDVLHCMQTSDIEMKKLVYLYLINYSKTQPDLAILAVNTFVKVRRKCARLRHRFSLLVCPDVSLVALAFLPSFTLAFHDYRTRKTRTLSSGRWLCAPWGASAWTRSWSISETLFANA